MQNLEQGTDDWHAWRQSGLGSSDAPIILGVSPYKTPHQLWLEKTGVIQPNQETNWAQNRGNNLEPVARAHYEILHDLEMPPTLAQHSTYPFLRASLDGYNEKEKIILEIKCPGREKHALAKEGIVPTEYIPQLDHQLLVTGALCVHYYSYSDDGGFLVKHYPEVSRLQSLLTRELEFWKCIEFGQAPELTDKDCITIKDKAYLKIIRDWKKAKARLDKISSLETSLKKEVLARAEHPMLIGAGVKIQKIIRKGSIDYSQIPELNKIDLDLYRKKSSESWRIDIL